MPTITSSSPPGNLAFKVVEWRPLTKGTLRGFITFELPSGLIIKDCSLHEKGAGARWIALPSRSFERSDGTTQYVTLVDFADPPTRRRFLESAMEALDRYLETHKTGGPDELFA